MGDGNFEAYLLEGGLPGNGWTRERARITLSGKAARLTSADGKLTAAISGGTMEVRIEGRTLAELRRVDRTSPTEGEQPPAGAVSLFDGSNADEWDRGRVETQVLDSFGLEGTSDETGGIYSIADPLVNACLPPLTWQTYDVDFTAASFGADGKVERNARMTVRLNGVLVQDDVGLPKTTNAAPIRTISPEPGPIRLQSHGNPVFYRNTWILEKK